MATLTIIQSGETKTLTVSTGVGAQGPQGPQGDATVTTEAIETALGYTPADAATNTGDQDLSGLATQTALAAETAAREAAIAALGTAAAKDTGTTEGTVPLVGAGGKLSSSLLPVISITDFIPVEDQAERFALTSADVYGKLVKQADNGRSYGLPNGNDASVNGDWIELGDALIEMADVVGLPAALANKSDKSNVLELDNTTPFTPTADNHPATKSYVDENATALAGELAALAEDVGDFLAAETAAREAAISSIAIFTDAVFEGDSLTDDASAKPNGSWAQNLVAKYPAFCAASYNNFAIAGQTVATMVGQYASEAGSLTLGSRSIFFLWAGVNDVYAVTSTATIANNIETILDAAIADFDTTVKLDLCPGTASSATIRKDSGVTNTLSTQQCYDKVDHFIPTPLIVDFSTDFTDHVHLNDTGRAKITDYIGRKLAGVYKYPAAIDPESIGSLAHYWSAMDSAENLDASDAAITVSGTEVKTVTDRAGGGDLIGIVNKRPQRVDRGDGVWTWQFNSNTYLSLSSRVLAQPITVFGVVEQISTYITANTRWLDDIVSGGRIGGYWATQSYPALGGSSGNFATNKIICQRVVVCLVFNGSSSAIYINGSKFATGSPGSGGFTTGIRVGGEQSGGIGLQWNGHIGAVAIYSAALTGDQIRGVSRSLCEEFKINFEPNLGS